MDTQSIVVEIDAEISRLQRVKALLSDTSTDGQRKPRRTVSSSLPGESTTRYTMSPEARAKMAAGQKARWAKFRSAAKKKARSTITESGAEKAAFSNLPAKAKARAAMSAEARAKIAAAQKMRWAKVRKAAKKSVRNVSASSGSKQVGSAKIVKKSAPANNAAFAKNAGASKTKARVAPGAAATPVISAS
jgi:hypothetical protein